MQIRLYVITVLIEKLDITICLHEVFLLVDVYLSPKKLIVATDPPTYLQTDMV